MNFKLFLIAVSALVFSVSGCSSMNSMNMDHDMEHKHMDHKKMHMKKHM